MDWREQQPPPLPQQQPPPQQQQQTQQCDCGQHLLPRVRSLTPPRSEIGCMQHITTNMRAPMLAPASVAGTDRICTGRAPEPRLARLAGDWRD